MAKLTGDEASLSEPFWMFESVAEGQAITAMLRRRFPETYAILSNSLEESDPFDIVYPDNPNEYSDVVAEILVLLSSVNGDLRRISVTEIGKVVREGLARRFGELPENDSVEDAVRLIAEQVAGT